MSFSLTGYPGPKGLPGYGRPGPIGFPGTNGDKGSPGHTGMMHDIRMLKWDVWVGLN